MFLLAVDESKDVTDVTQLCVWVRFPKSDSFFEELLCLSQLHSQGHYDCTFGIFLRKSSHLVQT